MTHTQVKVTGQRFSLGKLVITRGALSVCEDNDIDYLNLTMRHANGDFGSVGNLDAVELTEKERKEGAFATDDGLKLNAVAIENASGMIMSVYPCPELGDTKLWIQTMLADSETYTTILLPEEY